MAHVTSIWIHDHEIQKDCLTAHVNLKPAGQVQVKFKLPDKFRQCILDAAQAAADLHEQQMKAEILAEKLISNP
jgi:hypothetical protein